jgi:hypothetical protein
VREFTLYVDCGDENEDTGEFCDFEGDIDAWEDPELGTWGWTCPKCKFQHEEDV